MESTLISNSNKTIVHPNSPAVASPSGHPSLGDATVGGFVVHPLYTGNPWKSTFTKSYCWSKWNATECSISSRSTLCVRKCQQSSRTNIQSFGNSDLWLLELREPWNGQSHSHWSDLYEVSVKWTKFVFKEALAIRCVFSLVGMITKNKLSNCTLAFKIGAVWQQNMQNKNQNTFRSSLSLANQ